MTDINDLSLFAAKVVGVRMPGNWDRPVGYEGSRRFVTVYWDRTLEDVFITDGYDGNVGGAGWLFTDLIVRDHHSEICAALMACGCPAVPDRLPLGNPGREATHGIILDRFEHSLWVARLEDVLPFLQQQYANLDGAHSSPILRWQKRELLDDGMLHPSTPCHCDRGWVLVANTYVPCSDCQQSGRIELIPDLIFL